MKGFLKKSFHKKLPQKNPIARPS